jgi:hypothetical protein
MANLTCRVLLLWVVATLCVPGLAVAWSYSGVVSDERIGGLWEIRARVAVGRPPLDGGDATLTSGPLRCLPVAYCRHDPVPPESVCHQQSCALRGARFELVVGYDFLAGGPIPRSNVLSGALTLADGTVCPLQSASDILGAFVGPINRQVILPFGALGLFVDCPPGPLAGFLGLNLREKGAEQSTDRD